MSENQLFFYIIGSIGVMSILALGIVLFFNVSQKKLQAEALKREKMRLTFQKELLQTTIQTQEEERNRISRELHDDIGSKLNVIHLNLHLLKSGVGQGENIQDILNDIDQSLQNSIERTRQISHELVPPTLRKFGIQSAIEDLQSSINRTGSVKMVVEHATPWVIKDMMAQLHLYRIVQELVQNAIKHANAQHLVFTFEQKENELLLTYKDDGVGIPADVDSKGLGMSNLHSRVQILNGKWAIDHDHIGGALIQFEFRGLKKEV